ncbi:rho guanine nucleotide exchange factor 11 [Aplysia californica]|uniref:Rho guanine nucleotide exchange factor 11 n=1 Tax=Aplysia californica TaxID=6500 RepID=A0ABM0KB70_APLCA|nr:rho guanine nucleotide exchange factor 11 [Aplysia californica]
MSAERGAISELAFALFPNMEEMIKLHESLVRDIKERSSSPSRVVAEVGDLLLKRFDGEAGDRFRKGCAEYCRNQAFALDGLKKQTRRDPKLSQLLTEAQSNAMCRRLELKDLVPSQMQRLTKYPLLIDNLLKYTQANSEEHRRLERGLEKCKHILAYVNQAVKECENFHKLKDIQKKLDRKSVEGSTDPALEDVKNLNLTTRKLIFDGPLTWKLRSHRTVDLHALLFEDMLVLLQKQDDKYVLKCQNANAQSARDDHKFTHSPVLRLQNLLARNLATDKKSFFVVNISEVRAQMYEFSAATTELRIRWCNLINSKAEELKESATSTNNPVTRSASAIIPAPQLEQIETERNKIRITRKERSASTPSKGVSPARQVDAVDSIDGLETAELSQDSELIQPEEVNVAHAVTAEAIPVRTPLELLRENENIIEQALSERQRLVLQALSLSWDQCEALSAPTHTQPTGDLVSGKSEPESVSSGEKSPELLLMRALSINSQFIQLVNSATLGLVQHQQQQQQHHQRDHRQQQQQLQQQQQHHHQPHQQMEEESTSPSSPPRPLSTVSQGESSASEADTCSSSSSGVSSQPQQPGGPASPTGPAPSGTAPSGPAPSGLNVPVPMDQLKAMAQEMNVILSRLMEAITHGSEERHQLRQDLAEAQQKLDLLKDMQRQMTASGAVPPGRLSPRPQDASSPSDSGVDSDIPGIMSALSSTQQQIVRQQEQQSQQRQQQQQQSEGAEKAGELLEAGRGLVGSGSAEEEGKTRKEEEEKKRKEEEEEEGADFVLAPEELRCAEVSPGNEPRPVSSGERFEPGVLQEATVSQLEESVLDLSEQDGSHLLRDLTSVTSVTPASSSSQDQVIEVAAAEEDDDDDDNNEVSVADLPLPDVVSLGAEEEAGRSLTEMLANVELEDSEVDSDDNDTLTSRTSQQDYSGLATTVEDIAGEREEEEQRRRPSNQGEEEEEGEEEDRRTLRGSVDDNDNESLRKNSYPSPVAPGGPNLAMEDVEGEVGSLVFHTDQGAGGDGLDTMSRSSSVDPEKPKIELDCDNTEPIDV